MTDHSDAFPITDPNQLPLKTGDTLGRFDKLSYLEADRVVRVEDAYNKAKFNQISSDNLQLNRSIPDTRNAM